MPRRKDANVVANVLRALSNTEIADHKDHERKQNRARIRLATLLKQTLCAHTKHNRRRNGRGGPHLNGTRTHPTHLDDAAQPSAPGERCYASPGSGRLARLAAPGHNRDVPHGHHSGHVGVVFHNYQMLIRMLVTAQPRDARARGAARRRCAALLRLLCRTTSAGTL